jgi:hypothetical protein
MKPKIKKVGNFWLCANFKLGLELYGIGLTPLQAYNSYKTVLEKIIEY